MLMEGFKCQETEVDNAFTDYTIRLKIRNDKKRHKNKQMYASVYLEHSLLSACTIRAIVEYVRFDLIAYSDRHGRVSSLASPHMCSHNLSHTKLTVKCRCGKKSHKTS